MNGCEIVCPRSSGSGVSSYADARCCCGTKSSRGTERVAWPRRCAVPPAGALCGRTLLCFSSIAQACCMRHLERIKEGSSDREKCLFFFPSIFFSLYHSRSEPPTPYLPPPL